MKYIKVVLSGAILLSLPRLLAAQEATTKKKEGVQTLAEVMVQENRIQLPFSQQNRNIWIIDAEKIKNLPVRSVSELLSYVSGVDIRQRGPGGIQADISLDGGTFDQSLVLLNGVRVVDPQTGHNMMNLPITIADIERVEVLRGSASRVYGINALTGAINIITRKAERTGASAHVFTGSSFKKNEDTGDTYANYGIQASGALVLDQSSHRLSLGQEAGNGYRYNTAFNQQKVFYQGEVRMTADDQLELMAGYTHNNFGANSFYSSPGDKESEETVKTSLVSLGYTRRMNDHWTLRPRVSYRYNVDDYLYIKQKPDQFHNLHKTHVLDAELNNTFFTSIGTFGLGLEARKEKINSTNLGERDRNNAGVYGEYKFEPVDRLMVNAGIYANYNSDYGWQAFPGIDAGYNFYGNWRAFVNLGTGQRLPTYTDLYYKGPTNVGNAQLQPEKSRYAEGGVKYTDEVLVMNASYFYRRIDNFIDWVKAQQTDPWKPENFSEINTQGLTLSADYKVFTATDNAAISAVRLGASYTRLSPKLKTTLATAAFSRYALESLRNQLSGALNLRFYQHVGLTFAARYQERINYKSYTLFDTRLSYDHNQYSIYVDGANLFNVKYIEAGAVPMPGSWFTLGIKAGI